MAIVKPFPAIRPRPDLAPRVCELPYDVMSSDEARQIASGNPLSFLHVSKPEIDLPPGTDPYSPAVYAQGRDNFSRLLREGVLRPDPQPCFYLYRQTMGAHTQTGLVALASCEEYLANGVKKHELTRVDKEDDRVRHIETLGAQTGPAFLAYRAEPALDQFVLDRTTGIPAVDFVAADRVRHTAWVIDAPEDLRFVATAFSRLPCLYIADGHHRTAAAGRIHRSRQGSGGSDGFLAVIFPHDQLQILPYHRLVKDLNGHAPESLRAKLATVFDVVSPGTPQPARKQELGFYLAGQWWTLRFKDALTQGANGADRLDVALLQRHVLAPLFGIDNPRTSERVSFVGGIRGPGELERLVDSGAWAAGFSLFPTGIEDLMSIADAGEIMPPKSTWFEPKLRDAMFCHQLGTATEAS